MAKSHCLKFDGTVLIVGGVAKVEEITDREARFKLEGKSLVIKGSSLNLVALDKESGTVTLEVKELTSATYRSGGGIKGLFR